MAYPQLVVYTSKLRTSSACFSMNSRRGSTWSPIRVRKMSSAPETSSIFTCNSVRFVGVERGVAQLFGVHFAQAFEAGDRQAFFAGGCGWRPTGRANLPGRMVFSPRRRM